MTITNAEFICSNTEYKLCPKENIPEYAFIGRSNVGKSSLINCITNKKNIARSSNKPGKTQMINHFRINNSWFLVDLPGYGYASISKKKKKKFQDMIKQYLLNRKNLMCTFLLIDIRHKMQKIDHEFLIKLGENSIPFVIVFTKSDKISKEKCMKMIEDYKKNLLQEWKTLPEIFITSSKANIGSLDIINFINFHNKKFISVF